MTTIYHVRAPLPRRRSTQWYLDRRDFSQYAKTICGEPVTEYDASRQGAGEWTRDDGEVMTPCADCKSSK